MIKKNTLKAKLKTVESKRKLVQKKPPHRKSSKKGAIKKVSSRKRKKKIAMADLYAIINKVQLIKKEVTFATSIEESPVIEHTIQDAELKYEKVEMKTQVVFTLFPGERQIGDDSILDHLEILEDEFPDVDALFP